jgi:predicted nucleic acid-binding protein
MDSIEKKRILVIIPEIVLPEIASAIARGTNNEKIALDFVIKLIKFPNFTFVPVDRELALLSSKIAAKYRMKGSDSIYVVVCKLFNLKLITLDKEQKEKAAKIVEAKTPKEELNLQIA